MRGNKAFLFPILLLAMPLAAQTDSKNASVQGTVKDSVSGLPVPRAHVTLQGPKQVRYGATSAADGKFSFTGLGSGNYFIEAERPGYVRDPGRSRDRMISLKADDRKTADVQLTPTGSITGRITDSDGEPVEGANVQALSGRGAGSDTTDEKGQFRIGGLAPGKYHVRAERAWWFMGGRPEIRTDGTTEVHNSSTYYPGVVTKNDAGGVSVRAAVETTSIDIKLVKVPFVRVTGRVFDVPKDARADLMVAQGNGATGAQVKRDGSFELWRLDPGKYTLFAEWDAPNGLHVRTVSVPVEVAGSNIDNVELRVVPDSDIAGQLEFEDDEARTLPKPDGPRQFSVGQKISLEGGRAFFEGGSSADIDANGAFQLKKVAAGKYRIQVSWGTSYVKSVRLGSTTADGATLDLMRGSGGAELSVLMAASNSSISGAVQDVNGSAEGTTVVLVPAGHDSSNVTGDDDEEEMGSDNRYVPVGADGSYSFDHVAPGDFKIVAIPEGDLAMQGNRVIGFEDQMESVKVGVKEKVTKDLKRRTATPQ